EANLAPCPLHHHRHTLLLLLPLRACLSWRALRCTHAGPAQPSQCGLQSCLGHQQRVEAAWRAPLQTRAPRADCAEATTRTGMKYERRQHVKMHSPLDTCAKEWNTMETA